MSNTLSLGHADKQNLLQQLIKNKQTALGICLDGFIWDDAVNIITTIGQYICILSINPYTIPNWKAENASILKSLANKYSFQVLCDMKAAYTAQIFDIIISNPVFGIDTFVDWITIIPDAYIDIYNYYLLSNKHELSATTPKLIVSNYMRRDITCAEYHRNINCNGMSTYAKIVINNTPGTVIADMKVNNRLHNSFKKQLFGIATNCILPETDDTLNHNRICQPNKGSCNICYALAVDNNMVAIVNGLTILKTPECITRKLDIIIKYAAFTYTYYLDLIK